MQWLVYVNRVSLGAMCPISIYIKHSAFLMVAVDQALVTQAVTTDPLASSQRPDEALVRQAATTDPLASSQRPSIANAAQQQMMHSQGRQRKFTDRDAHRTDDIR